MGPNTGGSHSEEALVLRPTTFEVAIEEDGDTGGYITLSCMIYQLQADEQTKTYLWGDASTFESVKIPISDKGVWNRGKKVTYRLLIGDGDLLDPIEFDTEVEASDPVDGGVVAI